jgi:catechol 2,3-dioxygenase-like lactoylglutathione lyase family enzyme
MRKEAFEITQVHHMGLTVSSLSEALHFWVEVLGFELLLRDSLGKGEFLTQVTGVENSEISLAMVSGHGHVIELLQYTGPPDRRKVEARPCDVGAAHLAFFVDDLQAALRRMGECGWNALGIPQVVPEGPWIGTRVMYVRGPDGITIELMQSARENPRGRGKHRPGRETATPAPRCA